MFLAFTGALAIGLSLGLMGSGGSILTVPILVYLVGQDEKIAIAGSLFIVGCIAAVGGLQSAVQKNVHWHSVLWFGLPGMVGAWLGAQLSIFVSGRVQLLLFVFVMLAAGVFMLRPTQFKPDTHQRTVWKVALDGLLVGMLTGLVGVGGGFLIVPALVLLGGLPMHLAIGSSLIIIALKSFSGFAKYLEVLSHHEQTLDWTILGTFVGLGIVGTVFGGVIASRLPQNFLQKMFAGLLFLMSAAMLGAMVL
ncbi:MAG: UPF0721 transmembrane protein [Nitrospirales bacterium]|nr:MAG: UPF0721 transmembrane protein [Nitrospirales bacterium]